MADMTWTDEQKAAIETKGGCIVVSAAAGSGKTAVLVERVIRLLTDEAAPVPPERLLIVTFTRAAAGEMKQKIKTALRERAADNAAARAALTTIDAAAISTMDSFCVKLVRENFEPAGLSPDFRLLDDPEDAALRERAMTETLEAFYAAGGPVFEQTVRLFLNGRDDRTLAKGIGELYDCAIAHAHPGEWLDSVDSAYRDAATPESSVWGQILCEHIKNNLTSCIALLRAAVETAQTDDAVAAAYAPSLFADIDRIAALRTDIDEKRIGWDETAARVGALSTLTRLKSVRGAYDRRCADAVKLRRQRVKKILENCSAAVGIRTADFAADRELLTPVIGMLTQITRRYADRLLALKQAQNAYYFSDILHFAIDLMFEETDGGRRETRLCRKLAASYDAVLIDEYQDTTEAQDTLFTAVSDGGRNLFVVGDVKQSIYSFRLATPEIFNARCQSAHPYEERLFPARVILGKNFRSGAGILEFVNFAFRQLMSETAGGVDYDESEYLYYGGTAERDMQVVDCLLTESEDDPFTEEARSIAAYINRTVAENSPLTVKGQTRAARFSDFCILLRTVSGKAEKLAAVLDEYQIPVVYEKSVDRYSLPEARVLSALLNIIDNPQNDVALLSVLFFPLFGFSPDELAEIRTCSKASLYHCVTACAQTTGDTAEKCRAFLDVLSRLREDALSMKTSAFMRRLIYGTDLASLVSAMPGGEERLDALNAFIDCAELYENRGSLGFSGFVRYMEQLEETRREVSLTKAHGDIENAVRIMSIHKSKGLEFPFVILADTAKKFNFQDTFAPLITDISCAAAIRIQNRARLQRYETLPYTAVKLLKQTKAVSEELRLLYVALTRASHRLILSGSSKEMQKTVAKIAALLPESGYADPYLVLCCRSHLDMLLMALLRHPSCGELRDMGGATCDTLPCSAGVSLFLNTREDVGLTAEEEKMTLSRRPFTPELYEKIRDSIDYRYPYAALETLPAKVTASGFTVRGKSYEHISLSKPSFVGSDGSGGAARGIAYHSFLQHCDFEETAKDFPAQLERLKREMRLTDAQADLIDRDKIEAFLHSDIGQRIRTADRVYREFEFRFLIPARELYPQVDSDDEILVQGVADLIFIKEGKAVVVDYKTNARADSAHLLELYRPQLMLYKKAIESLLDIDVSETLLYSLSASRTIRVDEP